VRCPTCGDANDERARFCSNCGTALTTPAPSAEERKVVSVLFVDLVGFTARSDDADLAERAVEAAPRIVEAIEELNEDADLDLAVRGAVNTGEAVVALGARPEAGEAFVTGDVVNIASRLQGVAPVGGVVDGGLTLRAARERFVSLGATPLVAEVDELIASATAKTS